MYVYIFPEATGKRNAAQIAITSVGAMCHKPMRYTGNRFEEGLRNVSQGLLLARQKLAVPGIRFFFSQKLIPWKRKLVLAESSLYVWFWQYPWKTVPQVPNTYPTEKGTCPNRGILVCMVFGAYVENGTTSMEYVTPGNYKKKLAPFYNPL